MRLFLSIVFAFGATMAPAEEVVRPVQHPDGVMYQLLVVDQLAFYGANRAYEALVAAEAAYTAAERTLMLAVETGDAVTSSAEDLGALAQEAINARSSRDVAQTAYATAMATHEAARTAYDAALGAMSADDIEAAKEANDLPDDQATRVDTLENQLELLKAAVCAGHDYDHGHRDDYVSVCAGTGQTTSAGHEPLIDLILKE